VGRGYGKVYDWNISWFSTRKWYCYNYQIMGSLM